ncbi:uncharacterized protein K460DRAFT_304007 [Cucurbitaria berberidis CBS 394.84]|uniref:Heterokaryon incompatibility domain-containing protein n=1 Tax=Cucurbitaria berberidis CBS 394.84 TaxID=1168544 RepID=A0A9P4L9B5_9PLEO|nr:uncharacterized protein K460DRAFT_304007 [Cucurbitaria berberidis CBS 394.84]KAF1846981.1 hypothetical protein K460DRAFT_304007 [Cucurbitaria berberidis CBS 394.84]
MIECGGVTLQVGRNLWNFLRRFRAWDAARGNRLWIDAICINQKDGRERNHQVAQMGFIYSMAASTIAWLGEVTGREDIVFRLAVEYRNYDQAKIEELNHQDKQGEESEQRTAILHLLRNPYWTRVWIIQEFLLAQSLEIWCGKDCMDDRSLYKVFSGYHADTLLRYWQGPGIALFSERTEWPQRNSSDEAAPKLRLRYLIKVFSTSACSERYDKVYGLLGLARDATEPPHPIRPDYDKSAIEVLVDVLRNQHGRREEGDYDDHRFVESLRVMLGVPRMQLAKYILEKAPVTEPHIYALTSRMRLKVPLRFISTVTRCNSQLSRSELLACEELAVTQHNYPWPLMPRSFVIPSTEALIENIIKVIDPSKADNSQGHCPMSTARLVDILFRSAMQAAERCIPTPQQKGNEYHSFTGTNGVSGIAFGARPEVEHKIAVFPSASHTRIALLVDSSYESSRITGVAYLSSSGADEERSEISPSIWHVPTPEQRQDVDVINSRTLSDQSGIMEETNEAEITSDFCLTCGDPISLFDLCQRGFLDESQLKHMVGKELEAEDAAEEEHSCDKEGCSQIYF